MHFLKDRGFVHPRSAEITPPAVYRGRRQLLQGLAAGAAGWLAAGPAAAQALPVARPGKLAP
ncbi:MAG: protein-methionine-sulfoxide reductase catalytic subunit MsrP, partial [Burkholderiales bacterium]|nr:protein-methionine-sulfoxide reductase catalytic subunit MsrP [Burkholderiales bacterium]